MTRSCWAAAIGRAGCANIWKARSCKSWWPTSSPPTSPWRRSARSEEHTSELQSLMRISYAVFCLQKKTPRHTKSIETPLYHESDINITHLHVHHTTKIHYHL